MKMLKKMIIALYLLVMAVMGVATIVEKYHGSNFVSHNIYGTCWFTLLWALLAAVGVVWFVSRKVRRASTVLLHLSFLIILAGAFITHVTSYGGVVHLRLNTPCDTYLSLNADDNVVEHKLPFKMSLTAFDIMYHDGTDSEYDYCSRFTIVDGDKKTDGSVSMNNVFSYRGMRFYQSSYDDDRRGSVLSVNSDPYGVPVTYAGYALLFVSLLWMLIDPKGGFRRLLKMMNGNSENGVLVALVIGLMLVVLPTDSVAATPQQGDAKTSASVLPEETADRFGRLYMLHNSRICQLQTFAVDFTKKLCGKKTYKSFSPEQIVTAFIFYGDEWSAEPIICLKNGSLRQTLQLPSHVSVNTFFRSEMGGYILAPYVQEYYNGNNDSFHKQAVEIDERIQMIMTLRRGLSLKTFPFTTPHGVTTWYSPTETYPSDVDSLSAQFMKNVFSLVYQEAVAGNFATVDSIVEKMRKYQVQNAGTSLPTPLQTKAERIYNAVPFATVLFMFNLTMALLSFGMFLYGIRRGEEAAVTPQSRKNSKTLAALCRLMMTLSWAALTVCLALRWIVSGTVPMSNGYETMLFVAWLVMMLSLAVSRRMPIMLSLGFLMSGFFLLVAHIGQMNPQITHVMPVLNSPLLSIHVSVIMFSFATLSLTFITSLMSLAASFHTKWSQFSASLNNLSRLLLYPSMTFLGLGIFIGAIWANISWGSYWSWDAKETWALITFMAYAPALHIGSLPSFRRRRFYDAYITLAFLTILMTYFGCNYFLSGMHSYA